tara:strand:+ start:166 stop:339 length:174 start_codon:yes stop_codon:yes gene_type:complete
LDIFKDLVRARVNPKNKIKLLINIKKKIEVFDFANSPKYLDCSKSPKKWKIEGISKK